MSAKHLLALVLLASAIACTWDQQPDTPASGKMQLHSGRDRKGGAALDELHFDIFQRNCALFVGVRSGAWAGPAVFGSEPDDNDVHWNKCPGGTMVACKAVSTATGDTLLTGIPLPQ